MLAVILSILKIIGIILLALLGLILLIILIVLFVPIRYGIWADKPESEGNEFSARVKATWLLHLVNALFEYPADELLRVRIVFFKIISKSTGGAGKAPAEGHKKKKNKKEKAAKAKASKKDTSDNATDKDKDIAIDTNTNADIDTDIDSNTDTENRKKEEAFDTVINNAEEAANIINDEALEGTPAVKGFIDKTFSFIRNIKFKIIGICDKIKDVFENIEYYLNVITSDTFERAFSLCKDELIKLLKSIRPRKIRGYLEYGGKTPDGTGKIFSYYSMAYPYIGKKFVLVPRFDEEALNGNIYLKGRITIFTILVIAIKVYFNKDVKRTLKLLKKEN